MDIIIIPFYSRTEFLSLTLEHLRACPGVENCELWVVEDMRSKPASVADELTGIITGQQKFARVRHLQYAPLDLAKYPRQFPRDHEHFGHNSFFALEDAYQTQAEFVFHIEDDALVTPDFLRWSRQAHQFEPFVTCAENVWQPQNAAAPNVLGVCATYSEFSPRSVCFKRRTLAEILRPDHDYRYHLESTVQAYTSMENRLVIYPLCPRAFECGYYGSSKPELAPKGNLEERIAEVRNVIASDRFKRYGLTYYEHDPNWTGELKVVVDHRPKRPTDSNEFVRRYPHYSYLQKRFEPQARIVVDMVPGLKS
jgi:hypothetical protein